MAKRTALMESNGFTAEDYNLLRQTRTTLANMLSKFDKAEACGVDCAFLRATRDSIDSQLAAIQQHFMTPPPR